MQRTRKRKIEEIGEEDYSQKRMKVKGKNIISNEERRRVIDDRTEAPSSPSMEETDVTFDASNFDLYRAQVENGDYLAMYRLGLIYYYGEGVQRDYKKALKWFKLCEERSNDPRVQHRIALIYRRGYGVVIDHYEAGKWFLKAAKSGNTTANYNLGIRYLEGEGFKKDLIKSFKHFLVAAEAGHVSAQFNVALMWSNGQGVPYVNEKEASSWFLKAANNGHPQACANIGTRYLRGIGVEKSQKKALEWFFKAAELKQANTTIFLSALNKMGFDKYLPKDTKTAMTWYKCGVEWKQEERKRDQRKRDLRAEREERSKRVEERERNLESRNNEGDEQM